jgi:PLP dependent protein
MHNSLNNLSIINNKISKVVTNNQLKFNPKIIAVTKTFPLNNIVPLLEKGHIHFGENKIQEAENKWSDIKKKYPNFLLHMLGKVQTNKAKKAVKIFDFIHSLDSEKLAIKINQYEKEYDKKVKIFIQVNVGEEDQKSGISLENLDSFYNYCSNDLSINIIGLMCLPPINIDPTKYFKLLKEKSKNLNIPELSMGMSNDYEKAILCGSTYLRLGTAIFGKRKII